MSEPEAIVARSRRSVRLARDSCARVLLTCAALLLAGARCPRAAHADWRLVGLGGFGIRTIAVDPQAPSTIYASIEGTILKSRDTGQSWKVTDYDGDARLLLIDPSAPTTLYALDSNGAVARSVDAGVSWTDANAGLCGPLIGLGLDAANPETLWAANYVYVFRSTDGAMTWNEFFRPPHGITAFAVSPTRSGVYLGLYRDGTGFVGEASQPREHSITGVAGVSVAGAAAEGTAGRDCPIPAAQSPIFSVTPDPRRPNIVYAGYHSGICRTDDGGTTWQFLTTSLGTRIDFIDPFHPDTMYVFSDPLRRSTDGGETWSRFDKGIAPGVLVAALAADATGRLYAATTDGLYTSDPQESAPTPSPTPTTTACVGDCDWNGKVTVDELLTMVNLALGNAVITSCPTGDPDGDGTVQIAEILSAVNGALNGCVPSPTPTPDPLESDSGACYESADCFPCDAYPCRPFAASRTFCCHLALTIQGGTFSWCPTNMFDSSSGSCTQCSFPCK